MILGAAAPFAGHWSDRIGRTCIMIAMTALFLVSAYPLFAFAALITIRSYLRLR